MLCNIRKTTYKDYPALSIENDLVRAVFLPSQGAKLVSLQLLSSAYEFVYQGDSTVYRVASFGQSFLDGENAGVDDMFPTIKAGYYDVFPWQGTPLADHGEVWALEWDCLIEGDSIEMSTCGVRFPYRLIKRVTLEGSSLTMEYRAENLSRFPFEYIWASHMMLHAEQGSCYIFPAHLTKARCTLSDRGRIGSFGDVFPFPFVTLPDGHTEDLRINRGITADDFEKFYFIEPLREGRASVIHPDGHRLSIEFPLEQVPYLSAIQGEGGKLMLHCMFFEPCTAAYDRPDLARHFHTQSILPPKGIHEWYLKMVLGTESDRVTTT